MQIIEERINSYLYTTDREKMDIRCIHDFLSRRSYWSENISEDVVRRAVENSWCFGVFDGDAQAGFARLITDYATFGYLADVFILESYRGRGLSKQLIQFIMSTDTVKGFRRVMLATRDAHGLYAKSGFEPLQDPERWMQLHRPGIYSQP